MKIVIIQRRKSVQITWTSEIKIECLWLYRLNVYGCA